MRNGKGEAVAALLAALVILGVIRFITFFVASHTAPASPRCLPASWVRLAVSWLDARHIKNERLSFTNIYAIVSAGILSLLHSIRGDFVLEISMLVFLPCFSVIGLLTSLRLKAELESYLHSIEQTVARLGMDQFMPVVDAKGALTRYPKFRWLFPVFYAIASAGFVGLLAYRLSGGIGGKQTVIWRWNTSR